MDTRRTAKTVCTNTVQAAAVFPHRPRCWPLPRSALTAAGSRSSNSANTLRVGHLRSRRQTQDVAQLRREAGTVFVEVGLVYPDAPDLNCWLTTHRYVSIKTGCADPTSVRWCCSSSAAGEPRAFVQRRARRPNKEAKPPRTPARFKRRRVVQRLSCTAWLIKALLRIHFFPRTH